MGVVFRALDEHTDQPVALKFLRVRGPAQHAEVRRELAALRWLRLPGVVALRDDGVSDGVAFLVMDIAPGRPFPGRDGRIPWNDLEKPARHLLETLARIHLAGAVHRDLKPANILVDEAGRVVVLDLGLAVGRALESGPERMSGAGTPRTMAPEQIRGETVGPAADLYAVGVMLYTALAAQPPHAGEGTELLVARLASPAAPLRQLAAEVPEHVAEVIDQLLAMDAAKRPASALTVLQRLGAPPPLPALAHLPPRSTRAALRRLFSGSDALFHVPSDAAALLFARTGGEAQAVAHELGAWLSAGLATWDEGRVAIERAGLERLSMLDALEPTSATARVSLLPHELALTRQIAQRAPVSALLPTAEAAVEALLDAGHLGRAEAIIDLALSLARQEEQLGAEQRLLVAATRAALSQESAPALDRARHRLERALVYDETIRALDTLLQAARAAWGGEADRAATLLAGHDVQDEALNILQAGLRVIVARRAGVASEQVALDDLASWAADSARRGAWRDGWLGNLRYRQGRYDESAALHARAAKGKGSATGHVTGMLNAAMALLETSKLADAAALSRRATAAARALRLPTYEALARFVSRCADLRRGRPLRPDLALAAAAAELGPTVEGPVAAVEAAIAWRARRSSTAARLAAQARRCYTRMGATGPELLMAALEAAASPAQPALALAPLARRAAQLDPDFAVQALGLLRRAALDPPADWLERAQAIAMGRPRSQWSLCLDVLSFDEALSQPPWAGTPRSNGWTS